MPLAVERFVLSRYGSNTYVISTDPDAVEVAIVDPGGDPAPVLLELERSGRQAVGVLVTHCDVDHIEGVAPLADSTGAEVWVPAGEAGVLRGGETRTATPVTAYEPEHEVGDGDRVSIAGISFDVVGIAGHSVDHVAYCSDGQLFSGDLLFAGSVGRTDLPGGDWQTLLDSVERLIDRYGRDAVVYPGHGDPTTLGRELDTNPFLGELRESPR